MESNPQYQNPDFIQKLSDANLVQLIVDLTKKQNPQADATKIQELYANRMAAHGRDVFLLHCGLRAPSNEYEEIEQRLLTGQINEVETRAALQDFATRTPSLRAVEQIHEYVARQLELQAQFWQQVIKGYQAEQAGNPREVIEAEREVSACVKELKKKSRFFSQHIQRVFDFFDELNVRQDRGILESHGFSAMNAHWLVLLVEQRIGKAWATFFGEDESAVRRNLNLRHESACSTIFKHFLDGFPKPQELQALIEQEFVRARLALRDVEPQSNSRRASDILNGLPDEIEDIVSINSGLYGQVFKGFQRSLNRYVAIKVIKPDKKGTASIIDHAKALASVGPHPHLVTVYDVRKMKLPGYDGEEIVMLMEWLEGVSLGSRLGGMDFANDEAKRCIHGIISAVRQIHSNEVAHLDLNVGNLSITKDGVLKVFDLDPNKSIWLSEQTSGSKARNINDDVASVRHLTFMIAKRSSLRPSQLAILDDELSNSKSLDEIEVAVRKSFETVSASPPSSLMKYDLGKIDIELLRYLGDFLVEQSINNRVTNSEKFMQVHSNVVPTEFEESMRYLEERRLLGRPVGPGPLVTLSHNGFETYLLAFQPEYAQWSKQIQTSIVEDGNATDASIAANRGISRSVVCHVLDKLERSGLVQVSRFNTGIEVNDVSETLRRNTVKTAN